MVLVYFIPNKGLVLLVDSADLEEARHEESTSSAEINQFKARSESLLSRIETTLSVRIKLGAHRR